MCSDRGKESSGELCGIWADGKAKGKQSGGREEMLLRGRGQAAAVVRLEERLLRHCF